VIRTEALPAAHRVVHDDTASRPAPNSSGSSGSLKLSVNPVALASVTAIVALNPVLAGIETGRAPVSSTELGNIGQRPWKFPDSGVFWRSCEFQLGVSPSDEVRPLTSCPKKLGTCALASLRSTAKTKPGRVWSLMFFTLSSKIVVPSHGPGGAPAIVSLAPNFSL
jgi:hypothetical protein